MSAKHTPGRLRAGVSKYQGVQNFTAVSEDNEQKIVALCGLAGAADELESIANTCRLTACWNACNGVSTEHLEDDAVRKLIQDRDLLLAQRDELLAALHRMENHPASRIDELPEMARSAITKAIG